jgi:hypothetical protein
MRRQWIGGSPIFRSLKNRELVLRSARYVKGQFSRYLRASIERWASRLTKADRDLSSLIVNNIRSAELTLALHRYGAIYWASRAEASIVSKSDASLINDLSAALAPAVSDIFDVAVTDMLSTMELIVMDRCVPYSAFCSVGESQILVDRTHGPPLLRGELPEEGEVYDLHDFAHYVCALLNPIAFGCRYHLALPFLSNEEQNLIYSPNLYSSNQQVISDGCVFSRVSRALYDDMFDKEEDPRTATKKEAELAEAIYQFLVGRLSVQCPKTGEILAAEEPLSPPQAAILLQNKYYEAPASQVEQMLFTRSTLDVPEPLEELNAHQRSREIASLDRLRYAESRNLRRHRAHTKAYRLYFDRLAVENKKSLNLLTTAAHAKAKEESGAEAIDLWDIVLRCKEAQ